MAKLEETLVAFATKTAQEINKVRAERGALTGLSTQHKASIVGAINELETKIVAASGNAVSSSVVDNKIQTAIDGLKKEIMGDNVPAALDTLKEIADAIQNDQTATAAMATAIADRVKLDSVQQLTAQQKQNVETTLNLGNTGVDLVSVFNQALQ